MTIKTATLTVGGKSMTVLTNAQGMTLYYRTSDTPTSVCSGGCASAWPPALSSTMPSVSGTLPGTFSLLNDANGSQIAYNGHPLYTYSGDSAAGQANGQGVGNIWFAAPTILPASTNAPSGSTPTPGGYNYHQP
jgi:predicted lipoprotein with Yx(FWY)xxD motif